MALGRRKTMTRVCQVENRLASYDCIVVVEDMRWMRQWTKFVAMVSGRGMLRPTLEVMNSLMAKQKLVGCVCQQCKQR